MNRNPREGPCYRERGLATRRPSVGRVLLGMMIVIASSCGRGDGRAEQRVADTSASATLHDVEAGARPRSDTVSIEQAIDSLRRLPGVFTKGSSNPAVVEFDGERAIFRTLRSEQLSAVKSLIECIAREEEVVATFRARKVSLGYMCYTALESFVYVETTDDGGDSTGAWRGRLAPDADGKALLASRTAWREKAARGGIVILPP